jgi:hypothetical protein
VVLILGTTDILLFRNNQNAVTVGYAMMAVAVVALTWLVISADSRIRRSNVSDSLADQRQLAGHLLQQHNITLFALDDDSSLSFPRIVEGARRISIISRTGINLRGLYFGEFFNALDRGAEIRILLVDPSSGVCDWIYGTTRDVFRRNFSLAAGHLRSLRERSGAHLQVRTMPYAPTFGLLWIEKTETSSNVMQIQLYFLHGPGSRALPLFCLPYSSRWYSTFTNEFERLWIGAESWNG